MTRSRTLVAAWAMVLVLLSPGIAQAWDYYHGSWSERPTYGNWYWHQNYPNTSYVTWEPQSLWTPQGASDLKYWNNLGYQYHFELESYKPGGSSDFCENLEVGYVDTANLPISGSSSWSTGGCANGGDNASTPEELKVYLNEQAIQGNVWYTPWVQLLKRRQTPNTINGVAEVNLSFSYQLNDDWLGKFNYKDNPAYDFHSADRSGLKA